MDKKDVRFIGPVLSARAPDKKAPNPETAEIAENNSRVLDKRNGLFCFSQRPAAAAAASAKAALAAAAGKAVMAEVAALRPLRFILFQALSPHSGFRASSGSTHHRPGGGPRAPPNDAMWLFLNCDSFLS
jgi:hypothetical protein